MMDSVEFSEKARRNFVREVPTVDFHRNLLPSKRRRWDMGSSKDTIY